MNNNKTEINIKKYIVWIISFLMICICFLQYIHPHYSLDSYVWYNSNKVDVKFMLGLGRPFVVLAVELVSLMGINVVKWQSFFCVVMLLTFAISIVKMYTITITYNDIKDNFVKIIIYICCVVAFLNIFFAEWFQFVESYIMFSGALLFVVISIEKYLQGKYVRASLFLFIALGFYQGVLGIFINWVLGNIFLKYNKDFKKLISNSFYCIITAGAISVLNILSNKFLTKIGAAGQNDRQVVLSFDVVIRNIKDILKGQKFFLINCYNLLPHYSLLICLLILLFLFIYIFYKKIYIFSIYPIIFYASTFLPFLFTGILWMSQRTVTPYFSFFAIMAIIIVVANEKKIRNIELLVLIVMSILLFLNVNSINRIAIDLFSTNRMDYLICKQIENEILEYEEKTGITVEKILVRDDEYPVWNDPDISTQIYDTNKRALKVPWCLNGLFKFVMNRDFEVGYMDEESYQRLFEKEDWNIIDLQEQLVFENNVLYMMLY